MSSLVGDLGCGLFVSDNARTWNPLKALEWQAVFTPQRGTRKPGCQYLRESWDQSFWSKGQQPSGSYQVAVDPGKTKALHFSQMFSLWLHSRCQRGRHGQTFWRVSPNAKKKRPRYSRVLGSFAVSLNRQHDAMVVHYCSRWELFADTTWKIKPNLLITRSF